MNNQSSNSSFSSKKIGLALGSGSARGWAHIGVIKALEEAGIVVDCVAGTSIGALIAAIYASGNFDKLEQAALELNRKEILSFSDIILSKSGIIDGRKIANLIEPYVLKTAMESLPLPLGIVATNIVTGQEVVIREGDIVEAIRASFSLPGIFTPVQKDGHNLVDGGLVNPVPVSTVKDMGADFIIAVDLNNVVEAETDQNESITTETSKPKNALSSVEKMASAVNEKLRFIKFSKAGFIGLRNMNDSAPSIFQVLMGSLRIMKRRIVHLNLEADPPDILIQPNLGHINLFDFHNAEEIIAEGYEATKKKLAAYSKSQHQP